MEIGKQDKTLLRLLFSGSSCPADEVSSLLAGLDIDGERAERLLLLALLGIKTDWRAFPASLRPRLEGIYRSMRLRDIYGVPWLNGQIRRLAAAGIPVMIIKGMAMRTYYAPGVPREMSDFDLAVPKERFEEARDLALSAEGAAKAYDSIHSQTIIGPQKDLDLHFRIFKYGVNTSPLIWERAAAFEYEGVRVFVPAPEDMFIHIIDNKARDEIRGEHTGRRLMWLCDLERVAEKGDIKDWKSVRDRAEELGSLYYLKDLLPVFSEVFPERLPPAELEKYFTKDAADRKKERQLSEYKRCFKDYRDYLASHKEEKYGISRALRALSFYRRTYSLYAGPDYRSAGAPVGFIEFFRETHHEGSMAAFLLRYIKKIV
jgi:hypothetical protein